MDSVNFFGDSVLGRDARGLPSLPSVERPIRGQQQTLDRLTISRIQGNPYTRGQLRFFWMEGKSIDESGA